MEQNFLKIFNFIFVFIYLFCFFTEPIFFCELKFMNVRASLKSEDCALYYFGLHRVRSNLGLNSCFLF